MISPSTCGAPVAHEFCSGCARNRSEAPLHRHLNDFAWLCVECATLEDIVPSLEVPELPPILCANASRAADGAAMLAPITGHPFNVPLDAALVSDAIGSLLHLCDEEGFSITETLQDAWETYGKERTQHEP